MIKLIANLICKIFGHDYRGYTFPANLSEGLRPCHRCGRSIFGNNPYKNIFDDTKAGQA